MDHLAGHDLPPVGLGEHGARRRGKSVTLVLVDQLVVHRDRGPLRSTTTPGIQPTPARSRYVASTTSENPLAASCWISPSFGLQMSKPWPPATTRSLTPINSSPTARSRPLTTHTVQRWASACTVSRMLSQITPSLGRLTIGVNTPS
jgi:hypothetical protein